MSKSTNTVIYIYVCGKCRTQFMLPMELIQYLSSLILYQSKNCGHRIHVIFMMDDVYWYCQMKKNEWLWKFWKRNDYENFEQKGGEEETKSMPHGACGCGFCYPLMMLTPTQLASGVSFVSSLKHQTADWDSIHMSVHYKLSYSGPTSLQCFLFHAVYSSEACAATFTIIGLNYDPTWGL